MKHNHRTLLLVEDETIIAIQQSKELQDYGYRVVTAPSGEKAISTMENDPSIDLILMDIDLGKGIDGTEAAKIILEKHDLPIVFLSSHTEKEIVDKTEKITSYGYVVKDSGITVIDASIKMAFKLFEANRETAAQRNRLNTTLNSIGDAVISTDTEGMVAYLNPVAEKLTGWSLDDALGTPLSGVFHIVNALSGERQENPVDKVLVTGKIVGLANHTKLISKKGGEYQIADSGAPIRDAHGHVTGVVLVFRDVTEAYENRMKLELSEKPLKRNNEELTAIINALPGTVSVVDKDFNVIVANNDVYKKFGQDSLDEVIGKKCYKTRKGLKGPCPQCGLLQAFQTGEMVSRVSTPEEEELMGIATKAYAIPLEDENGTVWGGVEVIMDVTDIREAEKQLTSQKERLQYIIEGTGTGTWEWNVQTGEVIFNEKWAEIAGYTLEELSPVSIETWVSLAHPEDLKISDETLDKHFRNEIDFYDIECRLKHKNGSWIWVRDRGKVISWTEEGKPLRMYGTHQEITERKQAEEELNNSFELNKDLFKELQHRVKNSFTMIMGMIDLMGEGAKTDDSFNMLTVIRTRISAISELYSLLFTGDSIREVRLDHYLEKVIESIPLVPGTITIQKKFDRVLMPVRTAVSIGLITSELMTNAVKHAFIGRDSGTIRCGLTRTEKTIVLTVDDDGRGMSDIRTHEETASLGMKLVNVLTKQIDGDLNIRVDSGTRCRLEFSVPERNDNR